MQQSTVSSKVKVSRETMLRPGAQLVGFSGTRSVLSSLQLSCVRSVVSGLASSFAGNVVGSWSFAVGCCPSGLDQVVRAQCLNNHFPCQVFSVHGAKTAVSLRARSLRLASASSKLFSFPKSANMVRSGTWLTTFAASSAGKQVFVFLPGVSVSQLPCCRGVVGWSSVSGCSVPGLSLSGFKFFTPKIQVVQTCLF